MGKAITWLIVGVLGAGTCLFAAHVSGRKAAHAAEWEILHDCAEYGEFSYLSRDHRLVRLRCAAPERSQFKRVDGELVIEYDRVPENRRIVRL